MADKKLAVILPAAGLARRMKSYGPKCLTSLGNGQTVLSRQFWLLHKVFPDADVILVLGFEADKVYKFVPSWVRVVENEMYEDTNVARSIYLGLQAASNDISGALVIYADLVFNKEALINIPLTESCIVTEKNCSARENEVGVTIVDGYVSQFAYGLPNKWAHMLYLHSRELDLYKQIASLRDHRKFYGFEVMNMILEKGGSIKAIQMDNMKLAEIDTSKDIDIARALVKE